MDEEQRMEIVELEEALIPIDDWNRPDMPGSGAIIHMNSYGGPPMAPKGCPAIPMDSSANPMDFKERVDPDDTDSGAFTRESVFAAVSQGDKSKLDGLLDYLRNKKLQLTSPEFTDEKTGKTALLKALLNLKEGKNDTIEAPFDRAEQTGDLENDTIEVLLDIAEQTGDLENLINASYKDLDYKGQTALHVAIERRSLNYVKLLVQKGAEVNVKADGKFFQRSAGLGFYFGELPLSLAACTNQDDIVEFLVENPYKRADLADTDSQGNTALHALVIIADGTAEHTAMITKMYDKILSLHNRLDKKSEDRLESIPNDQGLTPLKLAAKLGKIGLFKHILQREFKEEEMRPLSRKLTEWVYGPVHCSLYDISSIDTIEDNSVLDIIVFGSEIPNRPEMLQIEPLRSLLEDKWDRFASKIFLMNFLFYLIYLSSFTAVATLRKEGQPPFAIENTPLDDLRCIGEIIVVVGAVWFLYKAITIFMWKPPTFKALSTDGYCDILFFLQATLLLISVVLYFCGLREYVGLLVLSLALAWTNILYYSRGTKQMGMYSVMMERMILGDLLQFLVVYGVYLFGFSAAIVALIDDSTPAQLPNGTLPRGRSFDVKPFECEKPSYNDIRFTILELFKFTIGMGDLEFTDHVQSKEVFYILLILYLVLTFILMLNMLIALMGNTVQRILEKSEDIWNLQRAFTILEIERTLLRCQVCKKYAEMPETVCFQYKNRRFFRVEEFDWKKWRSGVCVIREEGPVEAMMRSQPDSHTPRNLLQRIRSRRRQQNTSIL